MESDDDLHDRGAGGNRRYQVAAELAAGAGVPLLDRQTLARWANALQPDALDVEEIEEIEERVGGRLRLLGLSTAVPPLTLANRATPRPREMSDPHKKKSRKKAKNATARARERTRQARPPREGKLEGQDG